MSQDYVAIANSYRAGRSYKQCAQDHNCSIGTVRHALKREGVQPRERGYNTGKEQESAGRSRPAPKPVYHRDIPPNRPERPPHAARSALLDAAVKACKTFGGLAHIDDRYALVDTQKYTVTERNQKT